MSKRLSRSYSTSYKVPPSMVAPVIKQTWIVMGVLTNMFAQGLFASFPSILLSTVLAPDGKGDIKIDLPTASWIVSIPGIACLPGFWTSSLLMDMYGRRLCHCILSIPAIIGWLCIYFANNATLLIIGRALHGFAAGGLSLLGCVVIGEYTSPKNRGVFIALKTGAFCFGNTVLHILGHFYSWRTISLNALIPLVISMQITYTWPESPSWLVLRKRYSESQKSFYWLRGRNIESEKEIEHMIMSQKMSGSHERTTFNLFKDLKEFFKNFTKREFVKPVMILLISKILLEASARHLFPAFAMQIIEEVTGSKAQSLYYTLGIDIIITLSSLSAFILFKLLKRRTLLFSTGIAAVCVLYAVCIYLFLVSQGVLSSERTYIPIVLFAVYFILSNLGCSHMAYTFMGEIMPLAHRGAGISVSGLMTSICFFSIMKFTPYLLINIKVQGTFAILGTAMTICLLTLWFILPETKDRTLQEIEDYFVYGKKNNRNDEALKMVSSEKY